MMNINFRILEMGPGGKPGGQKLFEDLIVDLVGAVHPTARSIEPNPGDWGIDVIVGNLNGGSDVHIWQAKYFIDGCGRNQQAQIRDAYKQAVAKAREKQYQLRSWTLCIPVAMEPDTARWWDAWVKRQKDGVKIQLWQENHLRLKLMAEDNRQIYTYYFEQSAGASAKPSTRRLRELDPEAAAELESALFMRQMREARLDTSGQLTAAKHAFFNAELVAVDVNNRGVSNELDAIAQVRSENQSVWSADFGAARQQSPARGLRLAAIASEKPRTSSRFGEVVGGSQAADAFCWCASCGGCEEAVVDLSPGRASARSSQCHDLFNSGPNRRCR